MCSSCATKRSIYRIQVKTDDDLYAPNCRADCSEVSKNYCQYCIILHFLINVVYQDEANKRVTGKALPIINANRLIKYK